MNWLKELLGAQTITGVLVLANEYLEDLSEDAREQIPASLLPRAIRSEEELHDWHRRLSDSVTEAAGRASAPHLDLCVFFLRASARAIELRDSTAANGAGALPGARQPEGKVRS